MKEIGDILTRGYNDNEALAYAYDMPKDKYPTMVLKGMAYPLKINKELNDYRANSIWNAVVSDKKIYNGWDIDSSSHGIRNFHHLVY